MKMPQVIRVSRAQIMTVLALAILALLALCTLGIDVLHIYWQKSRLQAGTDAAALAGASYLGDVKLTGQNALCAYDTVPKNAACTYALANGVVLGEIGSIAVATDNKSVTVRASRVVPASFARLLGYAHFTVYALATAEIRPLKSAQQVLPVGLDARTTYQEGKQITIHFHDYTKSECGPGCWQGLALQSHNAGDKGGSAFRDNLENGCNCTVNIGDSVTNEPGAKTGPTQQGIDQRITTANSQFPTDTYLSHDPANLRAVILPLVDWTGCGGRCTGGAGVIVGFAEVWLVSASGSDINVIFIRQSAPGDPGSGGTDTGAVHPILVE